MNVQTGARGPPSRRREPTGFPPAGRIAPRSFGSREPSSVLWDAAGTGTALTQVRLATPPSNTPAPIRQRWRLPPPPRRSCRPPLASRARRGGRPLSIRFCRSPVDQSCLRSHRAGESEPASPTFAFPAPGRRWGLSCCLTLRAAHGGAVVVWERSWARTSKDSSGRRASQPTSPGVRGKREFQFGRPRAALGPTPGHPATSMSDQARLRGCSQVSAAGPSAWLAFRSFLSAT